MVVYNVYQVRVKSYFGSRNLTTTPASAITKSTLEIVIIPRSKTTEDLQLPATVITSIVQSYQCTRCKRLANKVNKLLQCICGAKALASKMSKKLYSVWERKT